jgi:hypothetical protein
VDTSEKRIRPCTVRFNPELHKRMRIAAFEARRPLNQLLNDLLEKEFPPPAAPSAPAAPVRKARSSKPSRQQAESNAG